MRCPDDGRCRYNRLGFCSRCGDHDPRLDEPTVDEQREWEEYAREREQRGREEPTTYERCRDCSRHSFGAERCMACATEWSEELQRLREERPF